MTKCYTVDLGDRSYPIYIGSELLDSRDLFEKHIKSKQVLVVTNEVVAPLYLKKVLSALQAYNPESLVLPDGEEYKTLDTVNQVFNTLLEKRFSRNCTIIALGGGVIGDLVGFASACYQRGVRFIQIPTTLLSQVDSSVGGKTGVNHPAGKNMIGAFYQPDCVVADTSTLSTLPSRELSSGLAEVIKYGLIRDIGFLDWIESHLEDVLAQREESLQYIVEKSCMNKAEIVAEDERESGIRAILNLGHTFGHAIETGMGYGTYLHGEAVAIGCCMAADLSFRLGQLSKSDVERVISIFKRASLPVTPPSKLGQDEFMSLMAVDKKNVDGDIRLILFEAIGKASLPCRVDRGLLEETLVEFGRS